MSQKTMLLLSLSLSVHSIATANCPVAKAFGVSEKDTIRIKQEIEPVILKMRQFHLGLENGQLLLLHACHNNQIRLAEILLEEEHVNPRMPTYLGRLVRCNDDPRKREERKKKYGNLSETPLGVASSLGHLEIAKLLIDQVNVNKGNQDESGKKYTPIELAQKGNHSETVEFLREHGAKLSVPSTTKLGRLKKMFTWKKKRSHSTDHNKTLQTTPDKRVIESSSMV